jgi:ABC-type sugar transport system permease subunit
MRFRHITWPMVSPTTFFLLITGVIGGFQAGFMQAYMLTHGGPNGATTTLSFWIYNLAYREYRMGYACAVAWILFLFVASFTILNWKFAGKKVHY